MADAPRVPEIRITEPMSQARNLSALMTNLENFVHVARVGSVSRAAQELFISQPALTARLHALEAEVGNALFLRTRRGMRLTDAGKAFLPYAERALLAAEEGLRQVQETADRSSGSLIVGATPSVSATILPSALLRVRDAFPATRFGVRTGHSEQIVDLVLRDEVHVGIVRDLRHPDLDCAPLFDDELILVVTSAHQFAAHGQVEVRALAQEHLVLFDRTSSYQELTNSLFSGAGVTPRSIIELDNIDAARRMVQAGLGVAILPMSSVADDLREGTLVRVAIAEGGPLLRRYVSIRRRDSPSTDEREEFLLKVIRELGSAAARTKPARARQRPERTPVRQTGQRAHGRADR